MVKLTDVQTTIVLTLSEKKQLFVKNANEQISSIDQAVGSVVEEIKKENGLEGEYYIDNQGDGLVLVEAPKPESEKEPKPSPRKRAPKKTPVAETG